MEQLSNAFTLFISLLVEAIPFLLLGVLVSSALLLLIDESKLITNMPRNPVLGAFIGSCVGFLFPVCECGNVPVARRLLAQGMPTSVAIGFLLAAPTINPIVIWSTWVAFGEQPKIVIFRIIFSLTIATLISIVFSTHKDSRPLLQPLLVKRLNLLARKNNIKNTQTISNKKPILLQSGSFLLDKPGKPLKLNEAQLDKGKNKLEKFQEKLSIFQNNLIQELKELGGMLIIGSAIAACIQVFVPREIVLSIGQSNITSIIAMMVLAGVVSICSTVDSFFALSFASTFTSSSLLAFLVFGPMIDIKAIGLMLSIFKPRIIIYLFVLAAQLTFILTLGYSYFN